MLDKLVNMITKEHGLIGLSLTRIFFGIAILYELTINFSVRNLLWGANGLYPYQEYQSYARKDNFYTLFDLGTSDMWVNIIVIGGIIVSLCYIIGYHTRIMGVLMAIIVFSLYFRNPEITHGGDNIIRVLFLYLMFARVGAYFSIDAYRKKHNKSNTYRSFFTFIHENKIFQDIKTVFHNFAWFACIIQIAFLYFSSGTYKVMGEMWQSGTALYYASRVQDFYTPYISPLLWKFEPMIIFMSHSTVLFQVSFPFLLLNRYTKYIAIIFACMLHFGIAVFMGLADFSWIMIGCELMLLLDHEYQKINRFITKWIERPKIKQKQQAA